MRTLRPRDPRRHPALAAACALVALASAAAEAAPAPPPAAAIAQRALWVPRGGEIRPLALRPDASIESFRFEFRGATSSLLEALEGDATDGFLVIRDGAIVYERYFGDFGASDAHLWASCTKSLVGLAFGLLAAEGAVDPARRVEEVLPELRGSGFGRLTQRQLLNMVAALDFDEDYGVSDPAAPAFRYFARLGMLAAPGSPSAPGEPRGIRGFLPQLRPAAKLEPGAVFDYQSPNVDAIGWIVERASGRPLQRLLAERIWSRLGAEHDAFLSADADLVPIATGGFHSTLRDAARFGLAVLHDGRVAGQQVLPQAWIADTLDVTAADREAARRSIFKTEGHAAYDVELEAYRNFWWILDSKRGELMARGVFGQYIYVHRASGVVIASFASAAPPSNARRDSFKRKLRATRALAEWLGSPHARRALRVPVRERPGPTRSPLGFASLRAEAACDLPRLACLVGLRRSPIYRSARSRPRACMRCTEGAVPATIRRSPGWRVSLPPGGSRRSLPGRSRIMKATLRPSDRP